jgi:capsular polysaccharide biosynthesis protein
MSRPGEGTYGHWLVDFLPRLLLLRTLGINGKYVFTDRIPDYAWQFFNLLGIDEADIVTYNPLTECVELEQAYVPTYLRSEDQFSSLISCIPRFFPLSKQVKGNKIYVARGDFRENQKVLNDELVIKSVLNFGFEIIYPHKLTIAQQIEIFSQASIVVGEYGSAMHNTLFCNPGTKVVLLQSNQILSMIQVGLGNALSHETSVLFCEALDNSTNSRSFIVDIELLNTILNKLCNVDNSAKQGLTLFQKVKGLFSR